MRNQSVFSYFMTETKTAGELAFLASSVQRNFGKYTIYTDQNTPFSSFVGEDVACAIFGLAVNVLSGESEGLAKAIAECCNCMEDVLAFERDLGGKYVIFFKAHEQYYLLGDATCSIPVFYNQGDVFVGASNDQSVADAMGYRLDDAYVQIRRSGEISQAMPYDITVWRQIKQLLPNHYLDINRQQAVRFVNAAESQKSVSVEDATDETQPMIERLLAFYLKTYKIYCPITSGRDSRVVLSFLKQSGESFRCYTIRHPEHHDQTPDIVVPIELGKKAEIEHRLVEDLAVSDGLAREMDDILGEGHYSARTLRIAHTIQQYFGDGAVINGDIIGQVGKCSLHRDIPLVFATPSYFRCKLHNYSKEAKLQLKEWLLEIKQSGEQVNAFDLFSIENRMGRWAAQENLIYNTLGQVYLNIFNCRRIIYLWTAVNRKKRKRSMLHAEYIKKTHPALLDVPFAKDEGLVFKISKSTWLTYLLSSYAKYYIEKRKYK